MELPRSFGRYTVIRKIANGGMAEIFLGRFYGERGFFRPVAIKRILSNGENSLNLKKALLDEANALMHLQHQNIVHIYDLAKEDENFFIAMEYVHGLNLAELIRRHTIEKKKLPLKYVIFIISQILQGLSYAHNVTDENGRSLKIVHRDISPPNILCSWNGEIKIADFGIAKGSHRTYETASNQLKGKFSYMSPEQVRGLPIDCRTDLYAVGIILFELLSGKRLFDHESDLGVVEKVRKSRVPISYIKNVPRELKEICCHALCKDRDIRFQSALEFLQSLNNVASKFSLVCTNLEFGAYSSEFCYKEMKFKSPITEISGVK